MVEKALGEFAARSERQHIDLRVVQCICVWGGPRASRRSASSSPFPPQEPLYLWLHFQITEKRYGCNPVVAALSCLREWSFELGGQWSGTRQVALTLLPVALAAIVSQEIFDPAIWLSWFFTSFTLPVITVGPAGAPGSKAPPPITAIPRRSKP